MPNSLLGFPGRGREPSYSDKYRDTEWGSPADPPPPEPEPPPDRRQGVLGIAVIADAATWILTGLVILGATIVFALTHEPGDPPVPQDWEQWLTAFIACALIVAVAHLGIGVKMVLLPRGDNLGCAGMIHGALSLGLLLLLVLSQSFSGWPLLAAAVLVVWWGGIAVATLLASQLVE